MPAAVALATCAEHADLDDEGRLLLRALRERGVVAEPAVWDAEPDGGWERFDLVVVRSTWDYTFALGRFLAWTRAIGPRLLNTAETIAWSADKRYLLDLAAAGVPVIATELLAPDAPFVPPAGRFVVKPAVSAGSRGAAVFDAARHAASRAHVAALQAEGRDVLVQPYLDAVDGEEAETALIFLDGELSHAMRKGPLLALDRAPVRAGWAPEVMSRCTPADDVAALGRRAHALVAERFGRPLYGRVDVLRDAAGEPAVLELELIEPSLFLDFVPRTAEALAGAILARLEASGR